MIRSILAIPVALAAAVVGAFGLVLVFLATMLAVLAEVVSGSERW